ncbi:hypothetical protein LTR85_001306 [Meristemomyces frigidus]|nr:hypothetical protein LTR85_001306 [Meristemomyces frigidus]
MRLLKNDEHGGLGIGADAEEVTFANLVTGDGKAKRGYEKIRFCGQQVKQDGLQYFWVDTCCIDKTDKAELSHAIRSMFHWYQNAAKCYVYLSDVSTRKRRPGDMSTGFTREHAFRSSRWFTRGWTLQELLAPSNVEFFSRGWEWLGNKISLKSWISQTTSISPEALDGAPLSQFSVNDERLRWKEGRVTKHEEDEAYSLQGILDVKLAPVYGEGAAGAFRRLMDEIDNSKRCVRDIHSTDPCTDRKRIEETIGGLLADPYRWVLKNPTFQQWQLDLHSRLLQQPALVAHIRKRYDQAGKSVFEDANAWVVLIEIFADMLQDSILRITYILIDALDECVTDLPKLLRFVAKQSSVCSRVKWIVSSRNCAVDVFIQRKVDQLSHEKQYKAEDRSAVLQHLTSNANGTFLWVAWVCQDLRATPKWNVSKKLALLPPGIYAFHKRMMQQVSESDSAEICQQVLASIAILYRPVTVLELAALVTPLKDLVHDLESVREIVTLCGSFLTLREDKVYFVHQTAKDFFLANTSDEVFPHGTEAAHYAIFSRSLSILSETLHRDMICMEALGTPIDDVQPPDPDPLATSRYPCVYWIEHLYHSNDMSQANGISDAQVMFVINKFLSTKYLYWLEGLSLCRSIAKGIVSMGELCSIVRERQDDDKLTKLVQDARRVIMYHKGAIESYPLQTYASALVFSPTGSTIRRLFQHEASEEVTIKPAMSRGWSACLQTLEGHCSNVNSVTFSHGLASGSEDGTVRIWDANNGQCLRTLENHGERAMAFA